MSRSFLSRGASANHYEVILFRHDPRVANRAVPVNAVGRKVPRVRRWCDDHPMRGHLTLSVLLTSGLGCATAQTQTLPAEAEPTEPAADPSLVAQRSYLLLADGTVHTFNDEAPTSAYVAGTLESGAFVPEGDVHGADLAAADGEAGWLELMDGICMMINPTGSPMISMARANDLKSMYARS